MSDYISKEAAINRIEEHLRQGDEIYPLSDTDRIMNHAFEIAASCVYNLPAADVVKIKKDPCEDCQEFDCQECKYRERGRLYGR